MDCEDTGSAQVWCFTVYLEKMCTVQYSVHCNAAEVEASCMAEVLAKTKPKQKDIQMLFPFNFITRDFRTITYFDESVPMQLCQDLIKIVVYVVGPKRNDLNQYRHDSGLRVISIE